MIYIATVFLATIVPQVDQYTCHLQWVERKLCVYRCFNKVRGFDWFEKKDEVNGCKLKKKFYSV